jgi:hypothetical protein
MPKDAEQDFAGSSGSSSSTMISSDSSLSVPMQSESAPNRDKWVVVSTTDLNYKADYQAAQYQAKGQDYVAALQNFKPGLGPNSSGASFTIVTK